MASESVKDELLAEASAHDTSLLEFFQSNLPQLTNIHLKDIRFRVLDDIALTIHGTLLRETDWMAFLNELGIVDNRAITYIKFKSKWREEFPIYLALTGPLLERLTFGDLIEVIMKKQRYDALLVIKPYVENLLKKSEDYFCVPKIPTAPPDAKECENLQGDSQKNIHMNMNSTEKGINIDYNPLSIKTDTISILILHTDEDIHIAEDLRSRLKKAGFSARTLSQLDHLLMMNSFEVIPALLSAVDFVVPIVSESFLKQIHSRNNMPMSGDFNDLNNGDSFSNDSNNQYIYQLLLNEYLRNKCLNFSVRPVIVPDFNRRLPKFDVLLMNSYKLWKGVPNFIEMLKRTKQLLSRFTV